MKKIQKYWLFITVGVICLGIISGLIFFRYQQQQNLSKLESERNLDELDLPNQVTDTTSDQQRIKVLEQAVLDLAKQVGELRAKVDSLSADKTVPQITSP